MSENLVKANSLQDQQACLDPTSTSVDEMFSIVLSERLKSGAMQRAIEKRVDDLINSTADDVFRSYGDVGKALKEKMTASIMPKIKEMEDLPIYHDFVMNRIKLAAQEFYDNRLVAVVDAELAKVFSEVPEQVTLSWIIEKVIEDAKEEDDSGDSITLIMEDRAGDFSWRKPGDSIFLYLDKEHDKSSRECDFQLHLSKHKESGKYDILSIECRNKKPGEYLSIGRIYNLEKVLFNIYAMKGRIDLDKGIDPDDYDTSYYED